MECLIYKSSGHKANQITADFEQDLIHFKLQIFELEDVFRTQNPNQKMAIFLIMISNTMNSYLKDLEQRVNLLYSFILYFFVQPSKIDFTKRPVFIYYVLKQKNKMLNIGKCTKIHHFILFYHMKMTLNMRNTEKKSFPRLTNQ